ncbi:MAG: hypothetical protein ACR652_18580 [Methylocystis sp.]|uniref:hypothetical protein n=1 Tax=Methylocystis sp. TaxID=1911079 RepID=UPI003DA58DCA
MSKLEGLQHALRAIESQIVELQAERCRIIADIGERARTYPNGTRVTRRDIQYEIVGVNVHLALSPNPALWYYGKRIKKDGSMSDVWTCLYGDDSFEVVPK